MKQFLREIWEHKFVGATGVAALVHSTWSLGTLFGGEQPDGGWSLVGWLATAFLIAFSLDIGQISTSMEIKKHGLTRARGLTFFVFAAATYYLQWLYMAHHMPLLDSALGIRAEWLPLVMLLRDAAIWIIPTFLPMSTVLYTFSSTVEHERPPVVETPAEQPAPLPIVEVPALPTGDAEPLPFGTKALELDAAENMPTMRKNKRLTASANGNGSKPPALRNKEIVP